MIAAIWSQVLGIAPIGRDENFLELGGHSLLAMQVVARSRAAYEINFTLRDFFETGTVAKMAAAIEKIIAAEINDLTDDEARQLVAHK
jgi:acyl carrier protein